MHTCTGCGRDIEPSSINGDRKFRITISGQKTILDIDVELCPGCFLIVKDGADPRAWKKVAAEPKEEFSASVSVAFKPWTP
jgi:hypothetical protein